MPPVILALLEQRKGTQSSSPHINRMLRQHFKAKRNRPVYNLHPHSSNIHFWLIEPTNKFWPYCSVLLFPPSLFLFSCWLICSIQLLLHECNVHLLLLARCSLFVQLRWCSSALKHALGFNCLCRWCRMNLRKKRTQREENWTGTFALSQYCGQKQFIK